MKQLKRYTFKGLHNGSWMRCLIKVIKKNKKKKKVYSWIFVLQFTVPFTAICIGILTALLIEFQKKKFQEAFWALASTLVRTILQSLKQSESCIRNHIRTALRSWKCILSRKTEFLITWEFLNILKIPPNGKRSKCGLILGKESKIVDPV